MTLRCQTCRRKIVQDEEEGAKTVRAAKANGQGPFCQLCRHLEMAARYARHRKLFDCAQFIERAKRLVK